ncbi:hypothetical protein SEA_PHARAOH_58 [Mycobacterium phage Pharaoh]|uniref:Uncharacterized protein n=1 Tax=Mycobacterium phage Pharaoh TaxID=2530140 RepID=A0A481W248_9CAUD|nr:hypothetical protein KIV59_gp32 [Mycobacterium phage Pharaoh]QBJ00246.1 hypothetical protein SEA_PHARAOH_58 [Mycobacterium phage Pharaoh]
MNGIWFVWEFIIWPLVMLSWAMWILERRKEIRGDSTATGQAESPEAVR